MPNGTDKVKDIITQLHKEFSTRYGFTVFDILVDGECDKSSVVLTGKALTNRQVNLLKRRVSTLKLKKNVRFEIDVLMDPLSSHTKMSGRVNKNIVDVLSDYNGKRLSTQISQSDDPIKIILKKGGKSLVLLSDNSLGWVADDDITIFDDGTEELWTDLKRLKSDDTVKVGSLAPLFKEANTFIGTVKYLHGGKSDDGVDCSALMQLIFKKAYGITLPRHTLDQMRCGVRVSKNEIRAGDLIFARRKGTNIMHVGLISSDDGLCVIHACLREKQVISENIDSFFSHYIFSGAKRVIEEESA